MKLSNILSRPPNGSPTAAQHAADSSGTPANPTGVKLNLGCGNDYREGYVNVDMNTSHRVDLVSDVTWLQSVADQSCAEVLAQDVLEHIPRSRGATALHEWNRVLRPGGRLTLRVPSLLHLLDLLRDPARQGLDEQKQLIQCLYGTQGYDGDFHFNGFTEVTLRHGLAQAGFEVAALRIIDHWLFEADAAKVRHVAPDPVLRIGTDEDFLDVAYQRLLGRAPDPEGAKYYRLMLSQGIVREAVLESLASSDEHRAFAQQAGGPAH